MLTLVYFFLILTAIVVVHEFGHYLFARIFGVRALEFAVGFGPRIFSKKGKKTEFRINVLPLGGYVKLAGEDFGELSEEIPEDELFSNKPSWQRFLIAFAGPLFSIIAGFIIFALVGAFWGFPEVRIEQVEPGTPAYYAGLEAGDRILEVNGRVLIQENTLSDLISKGKELTLTIERVGKELQLNVKPALFPEEAILVIKDAEMIPEEGSIIELFNGVPFDGKYSDFSSVLTPENTIKITFKDGTQLSGVIEGVSVTKERYAIGIYYSNFEPVLNKDFGRFKAGDRILEVNGMKLENGVDLSRLAQIIGLNENQLFIHLSGNKMEWFGRGLPDELTIKVLRNGKELTLETSKTEITNLMKEPNVFQLGYSYWYPKNVFHAFSLGFKWANELLLSMVKILSRLFTGGTSLNEFSGPIGMVTLVSQATKAGLKTILILVGFITLNIGVINLLPLPALDGGRMVLAFVEMVTRKRIDPKVEGYIHTIGFIIIMGILIYITFIDIGRFL